MCVCVCVCVCVCAVHFSTPQRVKQSTVFLYARVRYEAGYNEEAILLSQPCGGAVWGEITPCYGGGRGGRVGGGGGGGGGGVGGCVIRAHGALRGVLKEYTSGGTSDISDIGAKVKE